LNKSELIDKVASAAGVEKRKAEDVLEAFFDTVTSQMKSGRDKVSWPGFGAFSSSQRAARTGRNPQTGAAVKIPASLAAKFTASSTLKQVLNAKGGAKKGAAGKKTAPARKASAKKATATKKARKATRKG
jgi:DNA-binding protein HU-beta